MPALKRVATQNKMACKMAIMVINDFEVTERHVPGGQTSQFSSNPRWQNERGSEQFSGASSYHAETQFFGDQIIQSASELAWRTEHSSQVFSNASSLVAGSRVFDGPALGWQNEQVSRTLNDSVSTAEPAVYSYNLTPL